MPLGVTLVGVAQLLLEAGNLGLGLIVGEAELIHFLLARLVFVDQALKILNEFLVELQDVGIGPAGLRCRLTGPAGL